MAIRTVGIIGAGSSGITSVKSCLEEGLQPICFERQSGFGGVWYTDDEKTKKGFNFMFDSLTTNTSKEMMCMSDFPFPEDYPPFPTPRQMQDYWRSYVEHFKLKEHIRLGQKVTKITDIGSGRWKIVAEDVDNGNVTETEVDALIVSSGLQGTPNAPDIPGQQEFAGKVYHSQEFRRGTDYIGKKVVVLGASFSAGDVAVDCSRHSNMTYMSTRRGCWVMRRTFRGAGPWDLHILTRWFNYMPECFQELYLEVVFRALVNHEDLGLESDIRLYSGASIMLNDSINDQILCGKLKIKPEIKMLTKDSVVFADDSRVEDVEAVILATGYKKYYPYLEDKSMRESLEDKFDLYKYIFLPGHPTFAAVGLAKGLGPQASSYELQSRWVARVFSGKCKLPSDSVMRSAANTLREENLRDHGSVHSYVLWIPYVLDLAKEIGCLPSPWTYLFTKPRLALKLALGTINPYIFRLTGPHSWDGAIGAIEDSTRKTIKPTKTRLSKVRYTNFVYTLAQYLLILLVLLFAVLLKSYFF
ncbi:dimethylaniline monooxygenase [N-oxide-forming] 2-like [Antedon mediterranea]|uniref:dimethylaniline monooxygenase [N-oxide-forming] 2-like n=1 Tax=Antedon mediterranea TaxID=105859 RepID=UPI003AF84F77